MTAKLLLVGTGVISDTHAQANVALPALCLGDPLELHAADTRPEALAAFCQRNPGAHPHSGLAALLALPHDPRDVVVVATPPRSHAEIIAAALASGRHTLAEKPLALPAAGAMALAERAARAGVLLHEASNRFLGSGVGRRAAEIVARGELGTIYSASWIHLAARARPGIEFLPGTRWFLDSAIAGGGVGMDWAGYDLANLSEALGTTSLQLAASFAAAPQTNETLPPGTVKDVEFHIGATLLAQLGDHRIPVDYQRASATHAQPRELVEIVGTRAALRWQWLPWVGSDLRLWRTTDEAGVDRTESEVHPVAADVPFHHRPLAAMVAAIAGRDDPRFPAVPGALAAARLGLIAEMTAEVIR